MNETTMQTTEEKRPVQEQDAEDEKGTNVAWGIFLAKLLNVSNRIDPLFREAALCTEKPCHHHRRLEQSQWHVVPRTVRTDLPGNPDQV